VAIILYFQCYFTAYWRIAMTILKHLKLRSLDLALYPDAFLSIKEETITFPLWNTTGQMVGYQQYRPNRPKKSKILTLSERRYDTKITRHDGKHVALTAFGLHLLDSTKKELFVVEGIFDAVKLHSLGLNCLALLSSDIGYLKSWLTSLGYIIIPVCEGDEAGLKLLSLATTHKSFILPKGKDLGDIKKRKIKKMFFEFI
jgi:hypothetical protein